MKFNFKTCCGNWYNTQTKLVKKILRYEKVTGIGIELMCIAHNLSVNIRNEIMPSVALKATELVAAPPRPRITSSLTKED